MSQVVDKTEFGITLRNLVALSSFDTTLGLHCDNCTDEEGCKFLYPEIMYSLEDDQYSCGACCMRQATDKVATPCTIMRFSPELIQQLRTFPAFRAHVPCHSCWSSGKLCDNKRGACSNCQASLLTCERGACTAFPEPRDNWFCPHDCDQAHHDDGYTNVVFSPRSRDGYNAQQAARKAVLGNDPRVAVCEHCWSKFEDDSCNNEPTCPPCEARIQRGEVSSCKRPRCDKFVTCSRKECKFAHASQAFDTDDLNGTIANRPPRYRKPAQFPYH